MPQYQYTAKSKDGQTVRSSEFASSEQELLTKLARKSLTPISIEEAGAAEKPSVFKYGNKKIKLFDLIILCKQLETMIKGGIPLVRALETISAETRSVVLKSTLIEMIGYIRDGDSFSNSLKRFRNLFSNLFIAIVEAGEKVGALDVMLGRLTVYLIARDRITKKIITALTYPAFILGFFLVGITGITLFLIPRFKSIYEGFGAQLPGLTLTLFRISDLVIHKIFFIAAIAAVLIFLFSVFIKTRKGRYLFDAVTLKIPAFGEVIKKAAISKFARTLATLLQEGIPITEALDLVGKTSGNLIIEQATARAGKLILDGEDIPEALRKTGIFPSLLIQMATIGAEAGNLPELLDKTADFYEDEVDAFISTLSTLIEPILIVLLGAVLGTVIIALYLPIFKLGTAMTGGGH